jgi:hypothetical protein
MFELLLECDLFETEKSCTNCKDGVLTVQKKLERFICVPIKIAIRDL